MPVDTKLKDTFTLLKSGTAFTNPMAIRTADIKVSGDAKVADVNAAITALTEGVHLPTYEADLTKLSALKAKVISFTGDPANPTTVADTPVGKFSAHCDFLSGKTGFSGGSLTSLIGSFPSIEFIGVGAILTMLQLTLSASSIGAKMGLTDPNNPCGSTEGIFGSVTGGFNAQLSSMLSLLQGMPDLVLNADAYMAQIDEFASSIQAQITTSINGITGMMFDQLNFGIAQFMISLNLDP